MKTLVIILCTGTAIGIILRLYSLRLPLDWDHGLLLYQSYWYLRLKKFIAGWYELDPEPGNNLRPSSRIEEESMVRYQSLGFTFMNLVTYSICREKVWAYRAFDMVYSLVIAALLFSWGSLVLDPLSAAAGASLFFIFFSMPGYWPVMDNPEKFQLLFTVSGFLFGSLFAVTSNYLYCIPCGLSFYFSMVFKQNVAFVIAGFLLYLMLTGKPAGALAIAGTIFLAYAITFVHYLRKGYTFRQVFSKFIISPGILFYVLDRHQESPDTPAKPLKISIWQKMKPSFYRILSESSLIWAGYAGWFALAPVLGTSHETIFLFFVISIGTLAGFFAANKFFPYYYIPFLPAAALTTGDLLAKTFAGNSLSSPPVILLIGISAVLLFLAFRNTRGFFLASPFEQGAYMYSNTLFSFGASEEIGRHIRENTDPDDFIYVYNLNPEIYFFAQRKCPTNTLYIDDLSTASFTIEEQDRAEQALKDKLRDARPAYIVINKALNVPIAFFEGVTGEKYFLKKEYHAGFDAMKNPVTLQMYKLRKTREAEELVAAGEDLFGQERIDEAASAFGKALDLDPLNGDALNNLGVCCHHQGDHMKAVEYFVKAIEVNPSNRDTVLNLLDMDLPADEKSKLLQMYLAFNPQDTEMKRIRENFSG
jgi:tetratricopeptide (TPR) repeat protein